MADKPRVKAPAQRSAPNPGVDGRNRRLVYLVVGVGVALAAVAALVAVVGFGGDKDARGALEAAGCTFEEFPGVSRAHINDPAARPKSWNSFPPTSGPHYVTPSVYGFYTDPVELARVLHGLEHGGISLLYGPKTPADTADRLREIYNRDPRGLVVAPLPELGDTIALGAWTSENPGSKEVGTGHLAKCPEVDKGAFDAFIDAYRARGPEGVPLELLQPGGT
jgi:Protein of unknown function (DUF3105)